ncbi:MAG TPA: 2-keto-4-pentenoate hydratase [Candidatus Binatus sp.]|uniref:2-keto-4-pentenoate hydratase n=1 Tax=Candidatus Binatus sp. TaxID=2811406 RepID=UPI002B45D846|nr:2-keto-4-pentenoate hydratase [Candidatus Binatus sp.]HKN14653.1 2-keto-4-pentenoate hydratase [Candidatus Binatus sp.]
MDDGRLKEIADRLMSAAQTRRGIAPPAAEANLSAVDAYRIQMINVERSVAAGRRVVGRKVGLTSLAMQKMLGVTEPDFGHLFDDMILASDDKCERSSLLLPRVEPEIAFVLSRELRGPGIRRDDVIAATGYVTPAIEIIDTRIRDWNITLADTIADNASSARVVLGKEKTSPTAYYLASVTMTLEKNGTQVEQGVGAAVLGHPAEPVAWLANKLAEFGQTVAAGSIVMPGALCRAIDVAAGDLITARFGPLGAVSVRFV